MLVGKTKSLSCKSEDANYCILRTLLGFQGCGYLLPGTVFPRIIAGGDDLREGHYSREGIMTVPMGLAVN